MKATMRSAVFGAVTAVLLVAATVGCATGTGGATGTPPPVATTTGKEEAPIGMANPASVYCIEQGGELETRSDADGNQSGFCTFPDGSEKNQWDFWYENHPAGDEPPVDPGAPIGMANPAAVYCIEQGGKIELREERGGQSGYCILPDGGEKEEWQYWRESQPAVDVETGEAPAPLIEDATGERSEEIAREFVLESPTYVFDGIDGSLELIYTDSLDVCQFCWAFDFEFKSATAGYGDRTGKAVAEVITPHRVVVLVDRGRVTKAVMDGEWDMQFQARMATQAESEEIAREFVLSTPTYAFDGIEGSLNLKETLDAFCPYCWGFIFEYESAHPGYGDRSGEVLAQVITRHEIFVSMSGGNVNGATVDREWDAMVQAPPRPIEIVTAVAPVEPEVGYDVGAAMSEEESEELARGFVRDSRTFEFDGIEESLELVETLQARCPGCWVFTYAFDSRHAGYGDRSDQMLAQVITPHKVSIGVEQGEVVRAVLDGEWDMMAQAALPRSP